MTPPKPGSVLPLYTGLRVRDLERSLRFYRALGFRQTLRLRTGIGEAAQLEHPANRFTIELNYFPPGSKAFEPLRDGTQLDHLGFEVVDVDATYGRLLRAGGRSKLAPFGSEIWTRHRGSFQGRAAYVADPDGNWIELLGPPRPFRPRRAPSKARSV
jgi:lactoylglutathione lyase